MRNCQPGMSEFKLRELFKLYCGLNGAPHEAYSSICGCGPNAAILHYIVNDKPLGDGLLVLNDMGARGSGYVADITCTFPINGKFTKEQKEIYNIVLKSQRTAFHYMKHGTPMKDIQKVSVEIIVKGLIELGIITTDFKTAMEKRLGSTFYPHGLAHYMGLYVHDVGYCKVTNGIPMSQS